MAERKIEIKPSEVRRLMREAFKAGFAWAASSENSTAAIFPKAENSKKKVQSAAIRYVNDVAREYRVRQ